MTKRKRLGGTDLGSSTTTPSSSTQARKEPGVPPVLSSNWLQLQTALWHVVRTTFQPRAATFSSQDTFGNKKKGRNARKKTKAETSTAETGHGTPAEKLDGASVSLFPTSSDHSITRVLALDCEMVGVGPEGKRNALARVSIVNVWGNVVYDKHVRPPEFVTDFRTQVSGVRARDLRKGEDFFTVQKEVSDILNNRILVGHSLHNDLKVLLLSHPRKHIRDTQHYGPFRSDKGRPQALKHLAALHLGAKIQQREHDSVEDARAALHLYRLSEEAWEATLKQRRKTSKYAQPITDAHSKGKSRGG